MDEVEVSEWEEVQSPSPISEWETITVRDNYIKDNLNVFPPNNHEGLQTSPPDDHQHSSSISSLSSSPVVEERSDNDNWRRLRSRFEILKSGIVRLADRVGCCVIAGKCYWSFGGSVAGGVVLLWLLYRRVWRWRVRICDDRKNQVCQLLLLVKERDKKINELLLQIAHMNELLSARRNVPVIRVY
ncbi:hypothetical protein HS088_TW11G00992 [Tripterygium wilfordii]|uniref:Transmembrane protein n=1 Tax=Tripterygium wilfordii TaxID=458696 RepID=A0A7J7D3K6_TRIWF|nr:uncharacterized protein LOC120008920 [Tripterygium wilfordii]KAF5740912.1 hypothetical protein HS088_TW11G00992 [Tripterygium wilfordii]